VILITNVVKLKDTMIVYATLLAGQSLFVLQKLISILLKFWLGSGHQAGK
jgi:hypothetical protein